MAEPLRQRRVEAGARRDPHWGDTAVLVAVERQHGEVGGAPDQDLSMRITHVYRRESAGWLLVHRHADPLVRKIDHEQIAALARGEGLQDATAAAQA